MVQTSEMAGARKIHPGLVTPALQNLANSGFSQGALRTVEMAALRAASQTMQHRRAAGQMTSNGQLAGIVDAHLSTGRPMFATLPENRHIAHVMHLSDVIQRAPGIQLAQSAAAISDMTLDTNLFGEAPAANASTWLAKNLHAMQQVASDMHDHFPEFAQALEQRSAGIVAISTDRENLLRSLEAMADAQVEHPDVDADRHGV